MIYLFYFDTVRRLPDGAAISTAALVSPVI
jgi:hypothetical protein